MMKNILSIILSTFGLLLFWASAQAPPTDERPVLRPELMEFTCPATDEPPPRTEAERRVREARRAYAETLPLYFARVPAEPDITLLMPVEGVRVSQIADTFGSARGNRSHEGLDIFAPRGTPVVAATDGFIYSLGSETTNLGGETITLLGAGGRRYYYAHLSAFAEVAEGDYVTTGTVLGYVGTSGNAQGTPPHLHFGVYTGRCDWNAVNPYLLLVNE